MPLVRRVRSTGQEGFPVTTIEEMPASWEAKCMKGRTSRVSKPVERMGPEEGRQEADQPPRAGLRVRIVARRPSA
jgi:hypothetical protein